MLSEDTQDAQEWPHLSGFFTDEELKITESSASEAVQKIGKGQ